LEIRSSVSFQLGYRVEKNRQVDFSFLGVVIYKSHFSEMAERDHLVEAG
jgi:hypothetical protein